MKKSINQINAIVKTSDLWELWRQIDKTQSEYKETPEYLRKWFKYHSFKQGSMRYSIARHNSIYRECYRDLPQTVYGSVTMLNGEQAHASLSITTTGVKLAVSYYSSVNVCVNIRSNETFDNFDFQAYYDKYVEKHIFFAPGFFQDLQICKGYTKKEAVNWYRNYLKYRKPEQAQTKSEYLVQKLLNLNIDASYVEMCGQISTKQLFALWQENKGKKRPKMTFVERPNLWELSQEYDNEDELMNAAEEYLYHSEDKIFI